MLAVARRYLSLFWLFARVSVQDEAAYRFDFLGHLVTALFQLGAELVGLWTIFSNTRALAGWNVYQVLALLGVFRMMTALITFIIGPSMREIMRDIRDGKLDFVLLKPVNSQFFVSVRRMVVWRVVDMVMGLAMALYGAFASGESLSPLQVLLFLLMVLSGAAMVYSIWLVLATCAIWFTRLANIEMVFWNVFEAGRYPVNIYPPVVQWILTYIIPLAFLTTFPAAALFGKVSWWMAPLALLLGGLSLAGATAFWRLGLRSYSGASA